MTISHRRDSPPRPRADAPPPAPKPNYTSRAETGPAHPHEAAPARPSRKPGSRRTQFDSRATQTADTTGVRVKRKLLASDPTPEPEPEPKRKRASPKKAGAGTKGKPSRAGGGEGIGGRGRSGDGRASQGDEEGEEAPPPPTTISINRSPVLQLWGASVAQFVHPRLSWPVCLSMGNAIAGLCAVTKGRALGMLGGSEAGDEKRAGKAKSGVQEDVDTEVFDVMGFPLPLKQGADAVVVGGVSKGVFEGALRKKFGGERGYDEVRRVMGDALQEGWAGREDELGGKAFGMYEVFRPSVAPGKVGWGVKGELDLGEVREVVVGGGGGGGR